MIPVSQEPRGLAPNAPPLRTDEHIYFREDAKRGSQALLNAMRHAQGLPPLPRKPEPRPPMPPKAELPPRNICKCCGEPTAPRGLTVGKIQTVVAAYFNIRPSHMTSAQRSKKIAHARQVAMYLASDLTGKSLPDLGRRFGGRDHTTVLYGIRAVEHRMLHDPELAEDVQALWGHLSA